ncbi:MAG: ACT domain-containing protein [Clostridia bacterium]|jgi:hypothetical protein
MLVKQISVFIENKSGRLAEITRLLGENNIDISALSIADTTDFGILRLIVSDPQKAEYVLKKESFTVSCTSVIAISVIDKPGGLSGALEILDKNLISIEYMYAFVGKRENVALVILRVENPEKAVQVLENSGVKVLSSSDVYRL